MRLRKSRGTTPTPKTQAQINELRASLATAEAGLARQVTMIAEYDQINSRMDYLLTATADALKGKPAELHKHDWSDLPRVAAGQRNNLAQVRDLLIEGLGTSKTTTLPLTVLAKMACNRLAMAQISQAEELEALAIQEEQQSDDHV